MLASKLLNLIGGAAIAPAESLKMPPDFYYIPADRAMPEPGEDTWQKQRERIYINGYRRKMIAALLKPLILLNVAALVIAVIVFAAWGGGKPLAGLQAQISSMQQMGNPYGDAAQRLPYSPY